MNSEKEGSIGPSGNIWKGNLPGLGFLEALVEEVTFMLGPAVWKHGTEGTEQS